jgi:NAD+ synthase
MKGAVVAVSGGIDSSVTLALAVHSLGSGKVRAVTMPEGDVTPRDDVTDVIQLTRTLNVTCDSIEITPALEAVRSMLPLYDPSDLIANGNIKARVRMTLAYHYANTLRNLVIGSSNKTEWLTGYFTKYGDGASDLMPLAGLYKTQVRQLAKRLGIPNRIIEKAPSASLWPGQSTEGELGIKFEILDLILHGFERGMDVHTIANELGVEPSTVIRVQQRVKDNEHKRRLPLILRLSSATS